jgi:hypothetical protein
VLYGREYTSSGTYSFLSYSCQGGSGTKVTAFQTTHSSSETSSHTTSSALLELSSSAQSSPQQTSSEQSYTSSTTSSSANTSAATRETTAADASGGLSQGALIGIGVGVGLAAAGALVAASLLLWRRRGRRLTEQVSTYNAHYDGTRDGNGGAYDTNHHGYSSDVLRNQGHEKFRLAELTSAPVRHELDGTYTH